MLSDWNDFLIDQGAVLAEGKITHFRDIATELQAVESGTILADLSDQAIIAVQGDDAETFLHGQLTNDVKRLKDDRLQLNGYCSPKGRLLASFFLWKQNGQYLLQLPMALREPIQKRLTMFVLRAKAKLTDASNEMIRIGVAGINAEALIRDLMGVDAPEPMRVFQGNKATVLGLGPSRFEILTGPQQATVIWRELSKTATAVGTDRWNWLGIHAGEPTILPATQEQFVPQMINFELIGGVNFQKGCYPGQEIVARTQYLGKLKRRMYLAHIAADNVMPGDELFSTDFQNQASGMIVNAALAPGGGFDALAVIQIESAQNHTVHHKSLDGPALNMLPLPYTLESSK